MLEDDGTPYRAPAARLENAERSAAAFPWWAAMVCSLSVWLFMAQDASGHFGDILARWHRGFLGFMGFILVTLAVSTAGVLLLEFILLLALKIALGRKGNRRRPRQVLFWFNVLAADVLLALVVLNWITAT